MTALPATPNVRGRRPVQARGESRRYDAPGAAFGSIAAIALLAFATATGSGVARFNDFYREAWPAYQALAAGHVGWLPAPRLRHTLGR